MTSVAQQWALDEEMNFSELVSVWVFWIVPQRDFLCSVSYSTGNFFLKASNRGVHLALIY